MKTILITGVSRGIGKALAEKCLAEGERVIGTLRGDAPLSHKRLSLFRLDLSSPESITKCAGEITQLGEKIDVLINNAGVLLDEDETTVVVEKLRATLEVNLFGTVDFTERMIALMNKPGHIVNISSTAGSLEYTGQGISHYPHHYPSYKISKAALNMYTRVLASRLASSHITVSSVHPGWVRTEMGGDEADISPEEAADGIYKIATGEPQTGGFWFEHARVSW